MPEPRTYTTRGGDVREVPTVLHSKGRRVKTGEPPMSAGARLTKWNNDMLASGTHPATLRTLLQPVGEHGCGSCIHHHAYSWSGRKTFHKCDIHRLGESHSASSDIRVGWSACTAWAPAPAEQKAE